jgi:NADH:ubiquinone oxidoreductase subunit 3 (subunit A)
MELLFSPLIAFPIYLGLLSLLFWGRHVSSNSDASEDNAAYASGESAPAVSAAAGYEAFSQFALFFAVFHLAVLLLATGGGHIMTGIFLLFLMLMLLVILL